MKSWIAIWHHQIQYLFSYFEHIFQSLFYLETKTELDLIGKKERKHKLKIFSKCVISIGDKSLITSLKH
jgi:hypothetical protein